MKVVINRADYDNLLKDYPCLEKYREWYIPENDKTKTYYRDNCIIKDMDENELLDVVKSLMQKEELVIGYADEYEQKYGIDLIITIYDYYLE